MKKIIALVVAMVMVLSLSLTVFAEEPSTLTELLEDNNINATRTIDVPVDIKLDASGKGNFVDGPVSKSGKATVDYQATIYMKAVRDAYTAYMTAARFLVAGVGDLPSQLENCKITGQFTIKVVYPEEAKIPEVVLTSGDLYGFNDGASVIFKEASRLVSAGEQAGTKEATITLEVAGTAPERVGFVLASDMTANLETYLPDIKFVCEGVEYSNQGEYEVSGSISGATLIHDQAGNLVATINYNGKHGTEAGFVDGNIAETVKITSVGGLNAGPGTSSPSIPVITPTTPADKKVTVSFDVNGVEGIEDIVFEGDEENPVIDIEEIEKSVADKREGFALEGFYEEPTYATKLEGEVPVTENTTLYAKWINVTAPEELKSDEHIAYINGYPDGTVRPEDNITREEIAAIFYRLLKDDVKAKIETEEHTFADVEEGRWSSKEVATMANGGYLKGYVDGTFRPGANITRAELATIAGRFLKAVVAGGRDFDDIAGHWAEENIKSIANNEWIIGYEDGNFRPDDYITRAEAITIINRIIVRYVNAHGLIEDVKEWPDNHESEWYYYAVIEATNEHDFGRAEDQYNEIWNSAE